MGIEKKVISGVSSSNSDIQFEVMLERRVLRRFCVQKIVVETPMKDRLDYRSRVMSISVYRGNIIIKLCDFNELRGFD